MPQRLHRTELILIGVFFAVAIGFSVAPIANQIRKMRHGEDGTKDYPLWFYTGYRELHGISPYYIDKGEFPFMYPPGAAALLAPLTVFGKIPLVLVLVLLNSAAWITCILAPIYLVSGRIRGQPTVMYWLPSLICCVYIWDTYLEGQLAFCLLACLLGMLVFLQQRKPIRAGLLLALAAGFKAFPILALPYLIYRRHWKAVGATAVFLLLFLFVLPACFRGPRGAWDDLKTWRAGMMSPNTPEKMTQSGRGERSYTWQNGSLLAVTHRWLRDVKADTDKDRHDKPLPIVYVNVANLPFKTVNHIGTALTLLLGAAYLAIMPRERNRTRFTNAAESAMLLIMIILVCPLSFTYNNAWLMCGITVTLYFISLQPPGIRRTIAIIWLTLALFPLLFSVSTPDHNWRVLRAMGNTFLADLLLMAELAWLIGLTVRSAATNVRTMAPLAHGQRYSTAIDDTPSI